MAFICLVFGQVRDEVKNMQIAVVTGASSGIGREFALRIDEKCSLDEIWLIARREEKLKNTAKTMRTKARILPLDLAAQDSLIALRRLFEKEKPVVKILINAAGFGKFGSVQSQTPETIEEMIAVNIRALTSITRMALPCMGDGGGIVNLSSVSGFLPLSYLAVYAASKAYVLRFSQALAEEVKARNIRVTAVCPYWVASEFIPVAQETDDGDSINQFRFITVPYRVVKKSGRDHEKGKTLSLPGFVPKAIFCLTRILPEACQRAIWAKTRKISRS